jgi:hypothetical protein|tara:strand:+ start:136 stop:411 length:276 start_codon:yes stop_codon:yes gene_type:complete
MHNVDVQLEILEGLNVTINADVNFGNSYRDPEISEDAEVIINEITPVNSTEKLEYLNLDDMYVKKEDGSFAPILHELEDDVLSAAAEQCGV